MVKNRKSKPQDIDSAYFLKLVMYLIMGSLWLRIETATMTIPLPVGLVIGLIFATHEHFKTDRKIEYAVLLVAMFVGLWLPIGLTVAI